MYPSFILIRNGATTHEKINNKLTIDKSSTSHHNKDLKSIIDSHCIDEGLSQRGKKQIEQLKKHIKLEHIDLVLVSPLRRAIETCQIIFGDQKDTKIIVQPLLTEIVDSPFNISNSIPDSKTKLKGRFDFSKIAEGEEQSWFLNVFQNRQIKGKVLELAQEKYENDVTTAAVDSMKNGFRETQKQFEHRIEKLKEQLIKNHRKEKKKMAIVSHQQVLRYLTCTGYSEKGSPINSYQLELGGAAQVPILLSNIQINQEQQVPVCSFLEKKA